MVDSCIERRKDSLDTSVKSLGMPNKVDFSIGNIEDYQNMKGRSFNRQSEKTKRLEKKIQQLKLLKNPSVIVDCRI